MGPRPGWYIAIGVRGLIRGNVFVEPATDSGGGVECACVLFIYRRPAVPGDGPHRCIPHDARSLRFGGRDIRHVSATFARSDDAGKKSAAREDMTPSMLARRMTRILLASRCGVFFIYKAKTSSDVCRKKGAAAPVVRSACLSINGRICAPLTRTDLGPI